MLHDALDILPKNITTKPGSIIPPAPIPGGGAGGGFQLPSSKKESLAALEIKIEESKLPLIFSLSILFLVILAWGGLFFYAKSTDKKISEVKSKQTGFQERINKISLANIMDLQKGLAEAKALLASHIYSSNALRVMEELTLPNVQWESFSLSIATNNIALTGRAGSYTTLAKQMLIFEKDKDKRILKLSVSSISLDHNGGVSFGASITLNKELFNKFPKQQ